MDLTLTLARYGYKGQPPVADCAELCARELVSLALSLSLTLTLALALALTLSLTRPTHCCGRQRRRPSTRAG